MIRLFSTSIRLIDETINQLSERQDCRQLTRSFPIRSKFLLLKIFLLEQFSFSVVLLCTGLSGAEIWKYEWEIWSFTCSFS